MSIDTSIKRMFSLSEACEYTGMGKTRAKEYLSEIGALQRRGRKLLYDRKIIDAALDAGDDWTSKNTTKPAEGGSAEA